MADVNILSGYVYFGSSRTLSLRSAATASFTFFVKSGAVCATISPPKLDTNDVCTIAPFSYSMLQSQMM